MAALGKVSEASRERFFEEHAQLRSQGGAVGEELPEITREGMLTIVHEAVQTTEAEAVSHRQHRNVESRRVKSCLELSLSNPWPDVDGYKPDIGLGMHMPHILR